jgi:hypothetical protein
MMESSDEGEGDGDGESDGVRQLALFFLFCKNLSSYYKKKKTEVWK